MTTAELAAEAALSAAQEVAGENLQIMVMVRVDGEGAEMHGWTDMDAVAGDMAAAAFVLVHIRRLLESHGKRVFMGSLLGATRG